MMTFGINFKSFDNFVGLGNVYVHSDIIDCMNQQEKLANKKFKAGEDNLTTGIFQWSKDYTSGASNFSEAGKPFIT